MTDKEKQTEKKIEEKMEEVVAEEVKKDIPKSPETKTEEKKEAAAEKVAEEVVEESEKVVEKIVKKETSKKKVEKEVVKKELATARGVSLHVSKKHCMYICSFIKGKSVDNAMNQLGEVLAYKRAIPFKGEIPHRKGKGMMSGRYPVKAVSLFINMLKALKGNIVVNNMDLDKTVITLASASWASRPARRGNRNAKRTHVFLEAREKTTEKKK